MISDRIQITPAQGVENLSFQAMDSIKSELWESQRFKQLLESQRVKPDCRDACTLEYQFVKPIGEFAAEVLACKRCRQIVVNLVREAAA